MLVRPTRILRRINIVRGGWAKPGDLNHNGIGDDVLDIGCVTGTFATLLKQLYPAVEVIGLDPDTRALAHARRKAEGARVSVLQSRIRRCSEGRSLYLDAMTEHDSWDAAAGCLAGCGKMTVRPNMRSKVRDLL